MTNGLLPLGTKFLKKTKNQYIVHIYVQQGTLEIAYTLQIERFPYFQPV